MDETDVRVVRVGRVTERVLAVVLDVGGLRVVIGHTVDGGLGAAVLEPLSGRTLVAGHVSEERLGLMVDSLGAMLDGE